MSGIRPGRARGSAKHAVALDAIVAVSAKAIDAAKDATKTIPIVMGFDATTVAHRTEPPAGTPRRIAPTPRGPGVPPTWPAGYCVAGGLAAWWHRACGVKGSETEEARTMVFQSANGYTLLETGPAYMIMRAPLFGEVFVEWKSLEEWQARPPDAGHWEIEVRRDVDALKGHRQTVLVLGRCTLTYWPWEVVRKLLLLNRRTTRRTAPELPPPPLS